MGPADGKWLVFVVPIILLRCNIYFTALHNTFAGSSRSFLWCRLIFWQGGDVLLPRWFRRAVGGISLGGFFRQFGVTRGGLFRNLSRGLGAIPEDVRQHLLDVVGGPHRPKARKVLAGGEVPLVLGHLHEVADG